jgi:SAM-dependent methyltransferase
MPNDRWMFENSRDKMDALGVFHIDGGRENLDAVVARRHERLPELRSRLALDPNDIVVDLGSGTGFVAEVVAPLVQKLYCVDISPTFLEDAKARLSEQDIENVEFILTDYADFARSFRQRVTKIYALLLFIHFNYFDFLHYLAECNHVLRTGGLLYFDFNDGDQFILDNPRDSFVPQIPTYKANRKEWIFNCMHMSSLTLLRNIAPQLGYKLEATYHSRSAHTQALLRKVAEAPDLSHAASSNGNAVNESAASGTLIQQERETVQDLRRQLDAVYQSNSWKLTRPVRALTPVLRNVARTLKRTP